MLPTAHPAHPAHPAHSPAHPSVQDLTPSMVPIKLATQVGGLLGQPEEFDRMQSPSSGGFVRARVIDDGSQSKVAETTKADEPLAGG